MHIQCTFICTENIPLLTIFSRQNKRRKFFLSDKLHPQTISVVETRANSLGMQVIVGKVHDLDFSNRDYSGVLLQYPDTDGSVQDFSEVVHNAHSNGVSSLNQMVSVTTTE